MEHDENHRIDPGSSEDSDAAETAYKSVPPLDESADPSADEFPVVGIGASAGGLAAFEKLFTAMPPEAGMAFVVVQHLSPPHKSILPEIIQRYTSMPVVQVTDGIQVEPNSVYVIPPGSDLALQDGRLALIKPKTGRGVRLPIDFFFRSLAADQGERAIGIVLSGTGSDGSLGLKTIKAEGGLTIAQEPDTAEFGDMPRSAIATKDVDFVLPPQRMGELVLKFIHHQILPDYKQSESDFSSSLGGLHKLYYHLRSKTGHDFSLYKQSTLQRRIERRMKISLVKNLEEYIELLQEHPEEIEALFQEMLINVTQFFREPAAFQALCEKAIRPLIPLKRASGAPLRVWVAGCSSGEEAYSIAMVIQEQIETQNTDCKVQIYATDLDVNAINAARRGFYSDGSIENVPAERLRRFFHQEDEGYQVKKNIRDMVVFSTQNLISDPPFSKIDLLSCRNVLIYLERELQNQLFLQFHYSLNPEGILFLGNSESVGGVSDLFTVVDRKYKIFRRKETSKPRLARTKTSIFPREAVSLVPEPVLSRPTSEKFRDWVEKALLETYSPACVLVDPKHNILFIHGRTGKYLEPASGEPNNNLVRMAREGLKTELAAALHTAAARGEKVRREGVQVKTNGDIQRINLTVQPVEGLPEFPDLTLVVFEEIEVYPVEAQAKPTKGKHKSTSVIQLEKKLKEKDEYLRTIIEELEEANQDLKSTNEELQSSSEEMQSANEELETSKEELQSINEELTTINAELQNKNEALNDLNNDVYNLLSSTDIAMIFLDLDFQLRRFTPAIRSIYNLLPTDIGRPLAHFVSNLNYDHLVEDVKQVLSSLVPKAIEAQTEQGAWYLVNIKPYRTLENVVDGAVITFVNITQQKRGDELRRLGTIIQDSNDAITVQDFSGKILAWNRGASQMYGWSEAEALAMNSLDMIPDPKRAEALAMIQRLSKGETIHSFETQRVRRDGRTLEVWLTLTALVDENNQPVGIATTERDITQRKQAEQRLSFENRALKAANRWYQTAFETGDPKTRVEEACRILVEEAGYQLAWIGKMEKKGAEALTPVAWAGLEDGAKGLKTVWTLVKLARDLAKSSFSSRQAVAIRNIPTGPEKGGWHADAIRHHYGAFIVLPLIHANDPLGVLAVYAAEPEAFVDQEIEYLLKMSESIARAASSIWSGPDTRI